MSTSERNVRDGFLQRARALRLEGQPRAALAVLAELEKQSPRFSRLHEERGQCLLALEVLPDAARALLQAVQLNPTLPDSWQHLARIYRTLGDAASARAALDRVAMLDQLPREVVRAHALIADGDAESAEAILRGYLRPGIQNVGASRMLARLCLERGALADAESILESVLELAPDFHDARLDHAMVLLQQQRHRDARREAEELLSVRPDHREYLKVLGAACIGLGDYGPVVDLYAKLLAGLPRDGQEVADLRLWRGNALKTLGRTEEAIDDYRAAIAALPVNGVAWFSLANLKVYRFGPDEVAAMRDAEARPGSSPVDRCYLDFALGRALEDRGEYEVAWRHYQRGNAIKRAATGYRPEETESRVERQRQVGTASFFASRQGWGARDGSPVFIVGMPRSGSTLVEQILASHPAIEGTHELVELGRCAADAGDLADLTPESARRLGEQYLEDTRVYRRLGRTRFIDKMPNNFLHVGLIQLVLPHATIIDVRREPIACCVGNLQQLYGLDHQAFSYDVEHVARYYRTYLELMRHWDRVLPGRVLRVVYEDLVGDLEDGVRRLLAHCGLPWDAACLAFHETRRSVRTASSEQVRRPVSLEGIDRWRRFESWLGPLQAALGDAPATYRD